MSDDSSQESDCESGSLPAENTPQSQDIKSDPDPKNQPNPPPATLPKDCQKHEADSNDGKKWKSLSRWEKFERVFKVIEFSGIIGASLFVVVQWGNLKITNQDTEQTIDLSSNQVSVLRGQLKAQQGQSEVLQGQLKAMREQLDESKTARILSERAWIAMDTIIFTPWNDGAEYTYVIHFKNTGQTPGIRYQINAFQWTNNLISIPKKDRQPTPENPYSGLLAPSAGIDANTGNITTDDVRNIKAGKPYFIFGTIWYDDIFQGHHWSQFCVQVAIVTATNLLKNANVVTIGYNPIGEHNSCDDAETKQPN